MVLHLVSNDTQKIGFSSLALEQLREAEESSSLLCEHTTGVPDRNSHYLVSYDQSRGDIPLLRFGSALEVKSDSTHAQSFFGKCVLAPEPQGSMHHISWWQTWLNWTGHSFSGSLTRPSSSGASFWRNGLATGSCWSTKFGLCGILNKG